MISNDLKLAPISTISTYKQRHSSTTQWITWVFLSSTQSISKSFIAVRAWVAFRRCICSWTAANPEIRVAFRRCICSWTAANPEIRVAFRRCICSWTAANPEIRVAFRRCICSWTAANPEIRVAFRRCICSWTAANPEIRVAFRRCICSWTAANPEIRDQLEKNYLNLLNEIVKCFNLMGLWKAPDKFDWIS